MGVHLRIHDVPDEVHETLQVRAAARGTSLAEYVRSVLTAAAARPTPEELSERIRGPGSLQLTEPSERAVRRLRDSAE